jgi:hypothetical protein
MLSQSRKRGKFSFSQEVKNLIYFDLLFLMFMLISNDERNEWES